MLSLLMRFRFCVFWFMILKRMEVIPVDGQCTFKSCMTDGDEDLSICTQQNEGAQNFYQFDKRFSVLEHLIEKQGQFFDSQIRNLVNILDKNVTGGFEEHDGQLSQLLSVLQQVKVLAEQAITQSETLGQYNNNSEARIRSISEHIETLQGRLNRRLSVLEENFDKQGKNLKALPDQITNQIQLLSQNISNRWEVNDGELVQSLRALEERIKQQDQDVKVTILRQNITNHLGQRIEQHGEILTYKITSQTEILGQNIRDYGRNFTERLKEVTGQIGQRFRVLEQRTEHQDKSLEALSYRQERHDGNLQNISQVLINIILSQAEILGQNIRDYDRNLTNRLEKVTGQIDQRLHVLEQVVANQSKSLETISYSLEKHDGNLENISLEEHLKTIYLRNTSDRLRQSSAATAADCNDLRTATTGYYLPNGVYEILLHTGFSHVNVSVYCEFSASGDSWLIFQRRYDGSVNFNRGYSEYSKGFGDLNGEFWLGNEILHLLTSKRNYKLRIELEDWEGNARYAEYSNFKIGSSVTNFILNISGYSGNAGDGMASYNGQRFGTRDFDARNDCYKYHEGGWWYEICAESTINEIYRHGKNTWSISYSHGLVWQPWFRFRDSLKKTKMKISAVV